MTKARQRERKKARADGLTKQKIPAWPSLPPPTEKELAEMRRREKADRALDDFKMFYESAD
jgi:hypothetical protein